jgi:hypothetical protein
MDSFFLSIVMALFFARIAGMNLHTLGKSDNDTLL